MKQTKTPYETPIAAFQGLWPTYAEYARDAGCSEGAAQQQRARNSISQIYWSAIVAGAKRRGLWQVTFEALAEIHAERAGVTSEAEGEAA